MTNDQLKYGINDRLAHVSKYVAFNENAQILLAAAFFSSFVVDVEKKEDFNARRKSFCFEEGWGWEILPLYSTKTWCWKNPVPEYCEGERRDYEEVRKWK